MGASTAERALVARGELSLAESSQTALTRSSFEWPQGVPQSGWATEATIDSPRLTWKAGTSLVEDSANVPNTTAVDASTSSGNSLASNVYHVTTNSYSAPSILNNGIDPAFLNPNARFGAAFYVAEQPTTALAELAHYNAEPFMAINFSTRRPPAL
jgi:hypothetical protein